MAELASGYRTLEDFTVHDLESVRLLLRGGTVVDWPRLSLETREQAEELVRVEELDPTDEGDAKYVAAIRDEAVGYLKRTFDFPVPRPVRGASLVDLLLMASGRGHRQVCACAVLKVMHVVHHLKSHELRQAVPLTDQQLFAIVEEKVYRVIGSMLAAGLPIIELIGGRKHRDGQYTKLLAKPDNIAARIYDKIRFRLVTRSRDDIFPVLGYLTRRLFPVNYVIPGQSTSTLFDVQTYVAQQPRLRSLASKLYVPLDAVVGWPRPENVFSDPSFQVVHFVVDLPVRIDRQLAAAGITPPEPAPVIFALTEFQVVDRDSEAANETGEASHARYKQRQRNAIENRLSLDSLPAPATRRHR